MAFDDIKVTLVNMKTDLNCSTAEKRRRKIMPSFLFVVDKTAKGRYNRVM